MNRVKGIKSKTYVPGYNPKAFIPCIPVKLLIGLGCFDNSKQLKLDVTYEHTPQH